MAKPITIGVAAGEYMESVVVLEWAAKVGDSVKEGDTVVTVETAKAATEIGAPCDGVLSAIFVEPGAEIALSEVLGLIGTSVEDTEATTVELADEDARKLHSPVVAEGIANVTSSAAQATVGRVVASPAARRAAERFGADLGTIAPSSPTGRIKLRDITEHGGHTTGLTGLADLPADQSGPLKLQKSGSGRGAPVLMLHGFGADAMSWYPMERVLSQSHQVIRIDLPNHGQSPKRRTPDFDSLVREVVEAFDALSVESVHIVGHSLGGACALALAGSRPEKVASLTLIAPGGLGAAINGDFVEGLAKAATPASLEQWLKVMVADKSLVTSDFVGAAMASRAEPVLRAAQQQMARDLFPRGVPAFNLRTVLDGLKCPTRIIWGKADAVVPWEQALCAPGQVGLHFFEGVGHVPQVEITNQVLDILESVFKGVSQGQE